MTTLIMVSDSVLFPESMTLEGSMAPYPFRVP